jgi:hypothetical protein
MKGKRNKAENGGRKEKVKKKESLAIKNNWTLGFFL